MRRSRKAAVTEGKDSYGKKDFLVSYIPHRCANPITSYTYRIKSTLTRRVRGHFRTKCAIYPKLWYAPIQPCKSCEKTAVCSS